MKRFQRLLVSVAAAYTTVTILWPALAFAGLGGGGALPWDPALTTLSTDMQGPVAHSIVTMAIVGAGLMWGVSEHGTGVRKVSSVAFGGAAALGATQFMGTVFTGAGSLF
jgi:type IV secretory pathway VirB2 component (pilin)